MCATVLTVALYMGIWYCRKEAEEREKIRMLQAVIRSRVETAEAEAAARRFDEDRVRGLATLESHLGEPNPLGR